MQPFLRPELAGFEAYHAPVWPEADRLDANENPHDLPEWLKNKLAYQFEQVQAANRYPQANPEALKAAIGEYCGVVPDLVSLGNGSDELIRSILIATCLGSRGRVLTAEPTFSMYSIIARTLGIPYHPLPRTADFAVDLDGLEAAIAHFDGIQVLFLANPNSPTANLLQPGAIERLRQLPVLVVLDEAYYEFSQYTSVPLLSEWPNLIVLRTFSKAFRLASFRVGYALAAPEYVSALEKVRLPYNLPGHSQLAALTALEHRDLLLSVIPEILCERQRLERFLSDFEQLRLYPSDANFLFVRLLGTDARTLHRQLAERGSLVRAVGGGLRITIGTPSENDRLIANLAALLSGRNGRHWP
ncbi:histidinol-phosphate transaminase [Gloeobacter kilaueensis]|uniref:Histidinol-phosphate aminotransferase n=1 Tax=Gloeobacter kilaueensis (strain ATCC BAA-2537 / CCAP 1431/1 / ULC 316 / JS1) TaxID=1183438 RepID=U5QMC2_GLOK1|nr:histidinol-phosphate transaminase [Gloeobacter kilaueensis]AGY58759.1 histidinol-phosphate aminotransferase [Gloeobacter kilaueensis JS1]